MVSYHLAQVNEKLTRQIQSNHLVTELMICQGPLVGDQDKTQHVLSLFFLF